MKKLSGTQKYKLIDQAIASFKRTITESAARNLDDYIARQLLKYPACCQPCKWAKTAPKQKPCITCKWDKKKQTGTKYEPMEFILERRSIMER